MINTFFEHIQFRTINFNLLYSVSHISFWLNDSTWEFVSHSSWKHFLHRGVLTSVQTQKVIRREFILFVRRAFSGSRFSRRRASSRVRITAHLSWRGAHARWHDTNEKTRASKNVGKTGEEKRGKACAADVKAFSVFVPSRNMRRSLDKVTVFSLLSSTLLSTSMSSSTTTLVVVKSSLPTWRRWKN